MDFFESEAEVSDEEGVQKASSDEEEEEEGAEEGNVDDLINDEESDEPDKSDDSDDDEIGGKKRSYDDVDDRLEDDDYDLIEENLGVRVDRKKFRRLRRIEDDESDDEEQAGPSADVEDDRDAIAQDLFKPGEFDDEETVDEDEGDHRRHHHEDPQPPDQDQFAEIESGEEESDPDDFIVDDDGNPIARKKKKGHKPRYTDSALQEAQDIFGLDFEMEEFDKYGEDQYDEEDQIEDEYDEYEDDEVDQDEVRERRKGKRGKKGKKSKKSIYEVFEPSELERGHFTDLDTEIRTADVPERFMLRRVPVTEADNGELEDEAAWIYSQAFLTPTISNQEFSDQGDGGYGAHERKPPRTKNKIREALHFMRNQHFEVPFIAFYRKEYVEPELNFNDLYKVYHWDEKWCQLKNRKENLRKLFEKMQTYQFDQINLDSDEPLPESMRTLTEADIDKLTEVDTMEKLKDVYIHFLLYYGRDIPKMHNAAKQKPRKTKIVFNKRKVMKTVKRTITVMRRKKKKVEEKEEEKKEEEKNEEEKNEEEKNEEEKKEEDEEKKEDEVDSNKMEDSNKDGEEGSEKGVEEDEEKKDEEGGEKGDKKDEEGVNSDAEKQDGDDEEKMDVGDVEIKEEEEGEKVDEEGEKVDEEGEKMDEEGEKMDEEKEDNKEEGEVEEKDKEEGEIMEEDKEKEDEDGEIKDKDDDKEEGEMEDSEEEVEEEIEEEVETEEEEELEITDDEDEEGTSHEIKQATRKSLYAICQESGLDGFAKKFGLTPEQFAENLRDNYGRYDPEQYPDEPLEAAKEYMSRKFNTPEAVLKATRYMVALQLAHEPLVRHCVRQTFYERAKICVHPTKKGIKEIDEAHPCYGSKYLKNKMVKDLLGDQFMRLLHAENDKMLKVTISLDMEKGDTSSFHSTSYFEEIKQLYYRDEFSSVVQAWNKERSEAIEIALSVLYKEFTKEMRSKLEQESKDGIIKLCCRKLFEWLKVMPYQADQQIDDEDEDDDDYLDGGGKVGLKVLGVAVPSDLENACFCALLDGNGEVSDFLRLPHFLRRRNANWQKDRELKEDDVEKLKKFIIKRKPNVIAVASESRTTLSVIEDIKRCIQDLESEQQMAPINVHLVDSNCATIYQNSKLSESEFREYPPLLRQAISIGRRMQDPLMELARLCNPDDDLLCIQFHPLQIEVNKDSLKEALEQEFIYRVNEVGVDLNRAIAHTHTQALVQFMCGLGPRKGNAMIRTLKQQNQHLENRNHLVTVCELGPKVFINCAGFIKIDTTSVTDTTDSYIEVLDSTRIHPETYEWARKMAVDALEYDESAEDANPAEALEEILENPDKLKDLDLDAFAEELERQGYGNKSITLYDIRAELNSRYKDLRTPYHPPTAEEVFSLLTKETPETFYKGKLCLARVTGIARRRPPKDELDNANPVRNDTTGLWQCPFCQQQDFPELSEVWSHFDAGSCPGQAVGVNVRLENGLQGFVHTRNISDKKVVNPEDRVQMGMTLHCRIIKIDIERFKTDMTCKSSDLQDKNGEWAPSKDTYYDHDSAEQDMQKVEKEKKTSQSTYVKRVIVHPSFHNVTFKQAEKLIADMEQGEVIIRPSSKGTDHLTVTWKVDEGIFSHIDVREDGKENVFSLGKSLIIGNEEFEDLDEIVARHIQPMAAYVRDCMTHKYYRNTEGGSREIMDKFLSVEKKKGPARIPYFMSFSKQYPGKFLLSYQPRSKPRHEYVTITPDGYRYRQQSHSSINGLLRWFKEHFRDPIPGLTPNTASHHRTPMGAAPESTPAGTYYAGTPMLHKSGAAGMQMFTPSIIATPRQTPNATPQIGAGRYGAAMAAGYSGMPYATPQANPMSTPLGQATPQYQPGMMTPSQNPMRTPQYQPTPRSQWGGTTPQTQQVARAIQRQVQGGAPQPIPTHNTSRASVDWAQQAAQWAKQRQQPGRSPAPGGGMTPRQGGNTPRQGGMTPRQGGMTPRQGGNTPRQGGNTPRHGGNTPRQGGNTPRQGGMTPQHHSGMTPRQGGMTPRQGSLTPRDGRRTPRHGSLTPRSGGTPRSHHDLEPSPMSISTPRSQQGDATPLFDET